MKKILSVILTTIILTTILSACSGGNISTKNDVTSTPENAVEQILVPSSSPEVPTKEEVPTNTNQNSDQANFIGEEKAKDIALKQAGISAEGVRFDRIELDNDNGVWHYEVEFKKDKIEYDVDVKADDGSIISFEKDFDD